MCIRDSEQVGPGQIGDDKLEHGAIGLIVALVEVVHVVQHAGEDVGIFIDAAIDDGRLRAVGQQQVLLGAMAQEEDLQVK